jgi:hypothetical protein
MEVIKVLGREISDGNNLINMYTVPVGKGCVISNLNICNLDKYDSEISIAIAPLDVFNEGFSSLKFYLELNMIVYANCSSQRLKGVTLSANECVLVYGASEFISFNLFGSEFDQTFIATVET